MKSLLSLLLLVLPGALFAQQWQVSANGGLLTNTSGYGSRNEQKQKSYNSTSLSVSASYNTPHWQLGLRVERMQLQSAVPTSNWMFISQFQPTDNSEYSNAPVYPFKIASPALPITVFANRKLGHKGLVPYIGASAGIVPFYVPANDYAEVYRGSWRSGWTVGLQTGANYKLNKHWGINAELRGNQLELNSVNKLFRLYTLSATAGVAYSL